MDTSQWLQDIVVKPMEEILIPISNNNTPSSNSKENNGNGNNTSSLEKKMRPQKTQAVNCPRCNSTNTKFCYYNNYSLSQPRYFCKTCRRYWTEGGSLRNIPVGGGSRKNNKKTSSSSSNVPSSSSNSSKKQTPGTITITTTTTTTTSAHDQNPNPKMHDQGQDLNLGCFPRTHDFKTFSQLIQVPDFENSGNKSHFSALELLTGVSSRGCGNSNNSSSYMPSMYSEGFSSLPTLGFSLDGIGNSGYGSVQGVEESGNSGRALFPFEDLKHVSSTNDNNNNNNNMEVNNRDQQGDSTGYWNGILGGGSW